MYYHVLLTEDQLETMTHILESQRVSVTTNLVGGDPLITDLRNTALKEIGEIQEAVDTARSVLTNSERALTSTATTTTPAKVKTTRSRGTSSKTATTKASRGLDK